MNQQVTKQFSQKIRKYFNQLHGPLRIPQLYQQVQGIVSQYTANKICKSQRNQFLQIAQNIFLKQLERKYGPIAISEIQVRQLFVIIDEPPAELPDKQINQWFDNQDFVLDSYQNNPNFMQIKKIDIIQRWLEQKKEIKVIWAIVIKQLLDTKDLQGLVFSTVQSSSEIRNIEPKPTENFWRDVMKEYWIKGEKFLIKQDDYSIQEVKGANNRVVLVLSFTKQLQQRISNFSEPRSFNFKFNPMTNDLISQEFEKIEPGQFYFEQKQQDPKNKVRHIKNINWPKTL